MLKPLILLTNDDGYDAPGIRALETVATLFGDVVKIAPDKPQSGMGHAITINSTLRIAKRESRDGFIGYQCNGTPVDCIKIGLDKILNRKPDLIVSGINHGSNASINVIYSGTMSAAVEGKIEGTPAIGFSLLDHSIDADFEAAQEYAKKIIEMALTKLEDKFCLNVNIPKAKSEFILGIKYCRQAQAKWVEEFDKRQDPSGQDYYWLTGHFEAYDHHQEDTDLWALENGFVSIVPIQYDMTDHQYLDRMKEWSS